MLGFLARNLRDERVLLIATIRTDELDPRHPVLAFLAELERGDKVDRIDLGRLDRADLARLIEDELGRPPEPGLVDRTLERTGGNPFYAEQVLAVSRELDDGEVPPRLRDVVLARIALVSEAGQEILRVASAAGSRIDDDLLVEVAERPASAVRDALREVIDQRILVVVGGSVDPHLEFRHALLKEVIHADLFPSERARYHAAFATALERRVTEGDGVAGGGREVSAAELAYHWDAAGDERRALAASIDAGRAAERGYAWLEANRQYRRALDLWDRVPDADATAPVDRVDVLARIAATAGVIGDHEDAVTYGRRAIAELGPDGDPARAAELHERLRWYLWESGDREAAAAAVAEAERLVPADPPSATRARILAHQAGILMLTGRLVESIPVAQEALAVAQAAASPSDEALALGIIGWDLALLGRVDDGIEHIRAGVAIAEQLRGAEGLALGATNLATLLDRVGRPADALDVAVAGWERVRALGMDRTYGGLLLAIAAKTAIALGRWSDAKTYLSDGLARDPAGSPGIRLRVQRGRLSTWRGDLAAAAADLASARATDEAMDGTEDRPAILAALAELAAVQGHATETRAAVAEGLRMAAGGPPDPALAMLAATGLRVEADAAAVARSRHDDAALADARRRTREIATAVERTATLLAEASPSALDGPSRDRAVAAMCRAEAARVEDRDRPADWLAVAEAWDAVGRPYPAAYARFRAAGAILRTRGDRAAARERLLEARTVADRLGARPLLDEIDRLARQARLDVATGADGAAGTAAPLGLTERELEVLRLIAAGESNQQIADALFITRKTASVHASHIFDKLGAANRVEAAAIAHRLGLVEPAAPPPGRG